MSTRDILAHINQIKVMLLWVQMCFIIALVWCVLNVCSLSSHNRRRVESYKAGFCYFDQLNHD